MKKKNSIMRYLEKSSAWTFNGYCILAAFCTYFCMYAFRKPFSAGEYASVAGLSFLPKHLTYKSVLIICQVIGYTLSKYMGIKVISEMGRARRAVAIVLMIVFAELALLGFATAPPAYKIIFIFLNGIPLGMIWGLVFSFLEGRRSTEVLGAGLSASYIVASGAVKDVGRYLMTLGVPEFWMPFASGALFFPLLLISVYLLKSIPHPSEEDETLRTVRAPMGPAQRKSFLLAFAPGLLPLTCLYMFLTAYRDFRDNFAVEIWKSMGKGGNPTIITETEAYVTAGVLITLALVMIIKNNEKALVVIHLIMLFGSVLMGVSTLAYTMGKISPEAWMLATGLGVYLGYVPYGCILFDRLIARVGIVATAGFMIYVADALGYTASASLLIYKDMFYRPEASQANFQWVDFFVNFSYITSVVCTVAFTISLIYFGRMDVKKKQRQLQTDGNRQSPLNERD